MNKKILIILITLITGILLVGFVWGNVEETLFDQKSYNYTSYVLIPPTSPEGGSVSGYWNIDGKGRDFNYKIVLPDAEDPHADEGGNLLCYAKDGLNGTGRVNKIDITYNTLLSLYKADFKSALFNTRFDGVFDMVCAAWTGNGTFSNDGENFRGMFIIIGPATDWEGTFSLKQDINRIVLNMDYIYYPHAQKLAGNIKKVNKEIYM